MPKLRQFIVRCPIWMPPLLNTLRINVKNCRNNTSQQVKEQETLKETLDNLKIFVGKRVTFRASATDVLLWSLIVSRGLGRASDLTSRHNNIAKADRNFTSSKSFFVATRDFLGSSIFGKIVTFVCDICIEQCGCGKKPELNQLFFCQLSRRQRC